MTLKRRQFLIQAGSFSLSTLAGLGLSGWWGQSPQTAARSSATANNSLLVIFLRGGVDGLNVLVPYGDPDYYRHRSSIAIAPPSQTNGVLALTPGFGLHPALESLLPLWQQGQLSFVPACGLVPSSRSHFAAQDIFEAGVPDADSLPSGWMNRLLAELSSGLPQESSITQGRNLVRGVNFGQTTPLILRGRSEVANFPLSGPGSANSARQTALTQAFAQVYNSDPDLGDTYQAGVEAQTLLSDALAREMVESGRGAQSSRTFADRARRLGQVMGAEVGTQVAFLSVGGWDSHVRQGGHTGPLAQRLRHLGEGLVALQQGLGQAWRNTAVVVVSEFGRTVAENGNGGTDHGSGGLVWLLGEGFSGGHVFGAWPGLADGNLYEGRDLAVMTDVRDVMGSVLRAQFQLTEMQLASVFPNYRFQAQLPLL